MVSQLTSFYYCYIQNIRSVPDVCGIVSKSSGNRYWCVFTGVNQCVESVSRQIVVLAMLGFVFSIQVSSCYDVFCGVKKCIDVPGLQGHFRAFVYCDPA